MATKRVRLESYYLKDPEDERVPMQVASYAALLKPGFVLDMTQGDANDRTSGQDRIREMRVGKDEGVNLTYRRTIDPKIGNPSGIGVEAATFGMPKGKSAAIKFESAWDKGNRSFLELQVEGTDAEVDKITESFQETFHGPSDTDIAEMKNEMNKALGQQQWGATQDIAQAILMWRPDDTDAIQAIGSAMVISRDTDRAEKWMERLLELKPDSYEARLNLGNVWMDRQDYDKAIEQYKMMLELKPNEAFSPFIVATAYEAKGDNAGALEYYRKAAAMKKSPGPTDFPKLAKEAIGRLSQD
jgi:hypothetical protein